MLLLWLSVVKLLQLNGRYIDGTHTTTHYYRRAARMAKKAKRVEHGVQLHDDYAWANTREDRQREEG